MADADPRPAVREIVQSLLYGSARIRHHVGAPEVIGVDVVGGGGACRVPARGLLVYRRDQGIPVEDIIGRGCELGTGAGRGRDRYPLEGVQVVDVPVCSTRLPRASYEYEVVAFPTPRAVRRLA